jgi:hypothetical protein
MSQFDLVMQAGFSPRHVSFIETGRTHASRDSLLVLVVLKAATATASLSGPMLSSEESL